MYIRGFGDGLSVVRGTFCCFVDTLRPSEDVEVFEDFGPLPLMWTKGCTLFSCPGEGPVDRMKSAKSRMDSPSMRGSRASCRVTTFLLGEARCWVDVGPWLLGADRLGRLLVPKELSLPALTRGWTVTVEVVGLLDSNFFCAGKGVCCHDQLLSLRRGLK